MKDFKADVNKTRWGFMAGIAFGAIVLPISVILGVAAINPTPNGRENAPEIKPQPRHFDYLKIVNSIGAGYSNRKSLNDAEVWTNLEMASMVSISGAPKQVSKVLFIFPGHAREDVMIFNLYAIKQLGINLVNDESVVAWVADMIDGKTGEATKIFNDVEVSFKEFLLPKNSEIYLIFTPL